MNTFHAVVVSVADLEASRALWEGLFGFVPVSGSQNATASLAARWDIPKADIAGTILLRTPQASSGFLRLVAFTNPGAPVRADAANFDLCPKNLDVYVDDLPARLPELRDSGYQFRNRDYSEVTAPNGVRFREIHMHGPDEINIVLLQLMDEPMVFSAQGFAGIGALVSIVTDPLIEADYYQDQHGFEMVARHQLAGPDIEAMVGLPTGASLDICILGTPGELLGQLEVIAYGGVRGNDLYPRARPPATGILGIELRRQASTKARPLRSPGGLTIEQVD